MVDRTFEFLHHNEREGKPRERGITEIRGPYYDPMGPRELRDILETMGQYVDNSQIVELECMRSGLWGKATTWGRVVSWKGNRE